MHGRGAVYVESVTYYSLSSAGRSDAELPNTKDGSQRKEEKTNREAYAEVSDLFHLGVVIRYIVVLPCDSY